MSELEIAERSERLDESVARELAFQLRQERSKPIVNAIGLRAVELRVVPGTPIAHAISYLDNQWRSLTVFVNDPRVPITSNAAERAPRPPVLGRRNFLG